MILVFSLAILKRADRSDGGHDIGMKRLLYLFPKGARLSGEQFGCGSSLGFRVGLQELEILIRQRDR